MPFKGLKCLKTALTVHLLSQADSPMRWGAPSLCTFLHLARGQYWASMIEKRKDREGWVLENRIFK